MIISVEDSAPAVKYHGPPVQLVSNLVVETQGYRLLCESKTSTWGGQDQKPHSTNTKSSAHLRLKFGTPCCWAANTFRIIVCHLMFARITLMCARIILVCVCARITLMCARITLVCVCVCVCVGCRITVGIYLGLLCFAVGLFIMKL